jgi:methyl-CpG-binding domain protein 4
MGTTVASGYKPVSKDIINTWETRQVLRSIIMGSIDRRYYQEVKTFLPVSPYNFKQEIYRDDPWKMLIVCMMLNQTSYKQVDKIREKFFTRFPDAWTFIRSKDEDIINIIRPLGFYNRRCKTWKAFSKSFILGSYDKIEDLPGVGKYAADSWKIFQEGNINIKVEDKELKKYVTWANDYRTNK